MKISIHFESVESSTNAYKIPLLLVSLNSSQVAHQAGAYFQFP